MKKSGLFAIALIYSFGVFLLWYYAFVAVPDYATFGDAQREFIVYQHFIDIGRWELVLEHGLLSSCLPSTIVPALIQRMIGVDPMLVYKWYSIIILPVLPVLVFLLASRFLRKLHALWAALFFMAQIYFIEAPAYTRVEIALMAFALILLVIYGKLKCADRWKMAALVILAALLVISHYGMTFMIFPLLLATGLTLVILKLLKHYKGTYLRLLAVASCSVGVIGGLWYGVITKIPYGVVKMVVGVVITGERPSWYAPIEPAAAPSSGGFFDLATRDGVVRVAFGATLHTMNTAQIVEFILSWIIMLVLSYGLLLVIVNKELRDRLGLEFVAFLAVCYLMLAVMITVPYLSKIVGVVRTYYAILIPLSICLIIGLMDIARRIRVPVDLLLFFVVVPYYLCTSGLLHSFIGFSRH